MIQIMKLVAAHSPALSQSHELIFLGWWPCPLSSPLSSTSQLRNEDNGQLSHEHNLLSWPQSSATIIDKGLPRSGTLCSQER